MSKTRPFLKWPGNKYRCLNHIISKFPEASCLIEPFAGSAAVSLNSQFPHYILGEINPYLIDLYQYLQQEGDDFIAYCQQWFKAENNQAEKFYRFRQEFNQATDRRLKSALFLYLNRHGFNGLCRFNHKGFFNVPFGSYIKPYFPLKEMTHFHKKAQQTTLIYGDFKRSFLLAKPGDVIYCDPPYHPISKTANFTMYINSGFNEQTQLELAEHALEASSRGIHVFISNHDTPFTRKLYEQANEVHHFEVSRSIAGIGHKRVKVQEILAHFTPN